MEVFSLATIELLGNYLGLLQILVNVVKLTERCKMVNILRYTIPIKLKKIARSGRGEIVFEFPLLILLETLF